MVEVDSDVKAALTRMEATGKLDGVEFEHYVGGGLPPPYYRSEGLTFLTLNGRETIQFCTPNFKAGAGKDGAYPNDVYRLPAQPEDVKNLARLLREGRAFGSSPPASNAADAVRTELVLTIAGKPHKEVYYHGLPPLLGPVGALAWDLTVRLKAQGKHELEP